MVHLHPEVEAGGLIEKGTDIPSYTENDLLRVIAHGESDRVEFKESLSGDSPRTAREAICTFSNDLPDHRVSGLVFIGVRRDGRVVGLSVNDEPLRQLSDMKTDGNILPPPSMTVSKWVLNGKEVPLVEVLPSDSPPVRYMGRIWVCTGPRRGVATQQDERILNEKRRHGDRPFDLQPVPTASEYDLDLVRFQNEYVVGALPPEIVATNDRSLTERLAATKMIIGPQAPVATVLGILTLGKNPQDYLPGAYIQFLRIDGLELGDEIVDALEIRGSIPDLLRRLDDKLTAHNHTHIDFVTSHRERRRTAYPLVALQQITRNAVMHRAYESTNAPVRVHWFNDRVEVTSPGGPFGGITSRNFGEPGFVDYRNPNLAEAMKTLGYVQRFGAGIPTTRRLLKQSGHPPPDFLVINDHVRVRIWSYTNSGGAI